jgi:hypothetical protein
MRHRGLIGRRQIVGGLVAASTRPLWPVSALAASTIDHSLKFGEFEVSIISDGHLMVPTRFLARNVSEADIKIWLGQTADIVTPLAT